MAKKSIPLIGYKDNIVFIPRFNAKVKRGAHPDDCWIWTGGSMRDVNGGRRACFRMDRCKNAARAAYALFNGDVGPGRLVLHSCDNGMCVNPRHLRLGCYAENTDDMIRRGRSGLSRAKGSGHVCAKLTEADIPGIRAMLAAGHSWYVIGPMYGVSHMAIYQIARGLSWKHVP